jgi:hypothetical protein
MVRCATGHPSLSAYGAVVKGHTYYRCTYGQTYGKVAADAIAGHGATCNVREDTILTVIEQFLPIVCSARCGSIYSASSLTSSSGQAPPRSSGRLLDCKRR